MGITISLSKLREFFKGWHEAEYYQIHHITDDIISDTNNIKSKYAISSYGASKIQAQIGSINLNDYVTKTTYNNHVDNHKGTKNAYGHVKLIDDLENHPYYVDGEALSANQGYELNQKILNNSNKIQNIENQFMGHTIYIGRIGLKNANTNEMWTMNELAGKPPETFLEDMRGYGLNQWQKLETQPGYYVFALVVDKNNQGVQGEKVVIELNGTPYYRETAQNGIAAVPLKWGYKVDDDYKRRNWADRWRWVSATILPKNTESTYKYMDRTIHKIINHDRGYFDKAYYAQSPDNSNLTSAQKRELYDRWIRELELEEGTSYEDYLSNPDENNRRWLRRKPKTEYGSNSGYPYIIQ